MSVLGENKLITAAEGMTRAPLNLRRRWGGYRHPHKPWLENRRDGHAFAHCFIIREGFLDF